MTGKYWFILGAIVGLDLFTKMIANYFLPYQENVYLIGERVSLYLTYNETATGGVGNAILEANGGGNELILLSCLMGLILLSYIVLIRNHQIKIIYKVLLGIFLWLVLSLLITPLQPIFSSFKISTWAVSVVGKLTGLSFYSVIFWLTKNKSIRIALLLIIAGGLGNLLNHFYMPYNIIDFISIEGTYELMRLGVFNLADLSFDIGLIGLLVSIIIQLVGKVIPRSKVA